MTAVEWMFAGAVGFSGLAIVYHHALFPLYLKARARRPGQEEPGAEVTELPSMTVVVPAYNEETMIAGKVRNLSSLIYPANKLSVVIACDGCRDETAVRARLAASEPECRHLSIRVIEYAENRGKVAVLNEVLGAVKTDLVCLTDASAWLSVDAFSRTARHFRAPDIGVVAGTYLLYRAGSAGEATYWRYQRLVKQGEASLGAPLGVHGACYVMRTSAVRLLPGDTINDDFILPMQAVADGYRSVYDPTILALEMETSDIGMDFKRRCRIAAGNTQQVLRMASLLHPRHGGVALAFASGKALRITMPYMMATCLMGCAALAPVSPLFLLLVSLQGLGYTLAVARPTILKSVRFRLLDVLHYIVTGHAANLVGSVRYLAGLEKGRWTKISSHTKIEVPQ
ncbi:MAG: glycosyltransferase family 2 protein [Rhodospirillales bacterium]